MKPVDSRAPEPPGYATKALVVGAISGLPFAILWSWLFALMVRRPFAEVLPYGLVGGVLFGLFFGVFMAFKFKGETATVEVGGKRDFGRRLNAAMSELGYRLAANVEDSFTFKPSFRAGLAAGKISVHMEERSAVIVGPKTYVKKLLARLSTR